MEFEDGHLDQVSNRKSLGTPIALPIVLRWLRGRNFPRKLGIMDRLFGQRLVEAGECWVETGTGITWKLDLRNSTHRWIVYGAYEGPGFLRWAQRFLPEDGVVVDSGANIGQMVLYFAKFAPAGRILAFEPGNAQFDWLASCVEANNLVQVELNIAS